MKAKPTKQTEEVITSLKGKARFWTGQMNFCEYMAGSGSLSSRTWRNSAVPVYENSVLHLRSPHGTLASLKKNLRAGGLGISNPGNPFAAELARADILHFLETGAWLIPADVEQIPSAIEAYKVQKNREVVAKHEAERRQRVAEEAKRQADAKAKDLEQRLQDANLPELAPLLKNEESPEK